jgi:hypothetical protein
MLEREWWNNGIPIIPEYKHAAGILFPDYSCLFHLRKNGILFDKTGPACTTAGIDG